MQYFQGLTRLVDAVLINLILSMNLDALACTLREQRTLRYTTTDSPTHPPFGGKYTLFFL